VKKGEENKKLPMSALLISSLFPIFTVCFDGSKTPRLQARQKGKILMKERKEKDWFYLYKAYTPINQPIIGARSIRSEKCKHKFTWDRRNRITLSQ
jgi:hypothetical protein